MKSFFTLILFLTVGQSLFAQENETRYIKKDTFTTIITVSHNTYPADDFLTINIFRGETDKVQWGTATKNISYRYLGIDNQNNIHILRTEKDYLLKGEDKYELIFKLDNNKPTEITLLSERSQKNPLPIKISVEASNNSLLCKYLGNLPIYND